jgi:pyrroloquinoline quinone biosynthesis protein B
MFDAVVLGLRPVGVSRSGTPTHLSARARQGGAAISRSQASLAVPANVRDWFVLNASPDLRPQIKATLALHPVAGLRTSPISGVVVTGRDIDAVASSLHLRERHYITSLSERSRQIGRPG